MDVAHPVGDGGPGDPEGGGHHAGHVVEDARAAADGGDDAHDHRHNGDGGQQHDTVFGEKLFHENS